MEVELLKDQITDSSLEVKPDDLIQVMKILKSDSELAFNYLSNLTAVDYEDYFEVVYHLTSLKYKNLLEVRVRIDYQDPTITSVVDIWSSADWQEREVYDLFGINFSNHPNLKRILLTEDFVGHPLRKDYEM
ncbi:NADH-quinone oxidoreductase subunit C [Selenihalanaerobacter shriftii]|uniref:NADH-quinone oxidoreductase subunit C n=1 Tax=Selenihalanaerobacter shriftii TaxID=142842 RepID=A0A1T4LUQ6_9FIRM|nr:NADH-quinone oxidoreductase subunit C [Selenihalanaerobacter shriftii]SJZ58387.1 NADH-quinone oxidoreductase subunit C [Selenihalanaerobacter shriftii]